MSLLRMTSLLGVLGLLVSCGGGSGDGETGNITPAASVSTWQTIQTEIFDKACVSCHSVGSASATQSGLVLTADVAYEQLRDVATRNAAAKNDGYVRVSSAGGHAAAEQSFLLWKMDSRNHDHGSPSHKAEYGSMMPIGGSLTAGQIEFIEQWIVAGAPKEGHVVDLDVLNDTHVVDEEFEPLDVPVSGKQFHLTDIDVQPDTEREIFSYRKLNNPEPVYVNRIQVNMAPGSHHFVMYTYPEGFNKSILDASVEAAGLGAIAPFIAFPPSESTYRDLYTGVPAIDPKTGGLRPAYDNRMLALMQFQKFVGATQWPTMDYQFPEGTALRLPANTALELNSHYVNYVPKGSTGSVRKGEVYANLHYAKPADVKHIVGMLQLSNDKIYLPVNAMPQTLTRDFVFDQHYDFDKAFSIIQLFSHAHRHMQRFTVKVIGGAMQGDKMRPDGFVVYEEDDWQHPEIKRFDDAKATDAAKRPLVFGKGQGLRLEVVYLNDGTEPVTYGALSENEMMILFGYYYTDKIAAP